MEIHLFGKYTFMVIMVLSMYPDKKTKRQKDKKTNRQIDKKTKRQKDKKTKRQKDKKN